MDLNSFQRKVIIFLFLSVLAGALFLSREGSIKKTLVEKTAPKIKTQQEESQIAKIDINTADIALLTKLPCIGPGIARQIVDYRNLHGPYKTLEDLLNVPGIGPKRISRIREKINLEEKNILKEGSPITPATKTEDTVALKKLNLNTADEEGLCGIPGIGPKMAHAIIDYRNKFGLFHSLDELMEVPRIGKKTYERLKEYLYLDGELKPAEKQIAAGKINNTNKTDLSGKCPHCGKSLWEKGRRKKLYIRCPNCLKLLD